MQPPRKDTIFFLDGVELRVVRQLDDFHVQLENVMTGELEKRSSYSLQEAYMQRRLKTKSEMLRDARRGTSKRQPDRMDGMSRAARTETHRRIDYLVRLEKMRAFGKSRKELRQCLAEIAELRGEAYGRYRPCVTLRVGLPPQFGRPRYLRRLLGAAPRHAAEDLLDQAVRRSGA